MACARPVSVLLMRNRSLSTFRCTLRPIRSKLIALDPRPCPIFAVIVLCRLWARGWAAAIVVSIATITSNLCTAALLHRYGAVCDRFRAAPSTDRGGGGEIVVSHALCNVVHCDLRESAGERCKTLASCDDVKYMDTLSAARKALSTCHCGQHGRRAAVQRRVSAAQPDRTPTCTGTALT